MTEWQDRVIVERDELGKKLRSLKSFLARNEQNRKIGHIEWFRLDRQQFAMSKYLEVLDERIEAFKEKAND